MTTPFCLYPIIMFNNMDLFIDKQPLHKNSSISNCSPLKVAVRLQYCVIARSPYLLFGLIYVCIYVLRDNVIV